MLLEGDTQAARSTLEELVPRFYAIGDAPAQAYSLRLLGLALLRQGKSHDAETMVREALRVTIGLGDRKMTIDCLVVLGAIAGELSHHERAAHLWGAAETARQASGYTLFTVDRLNYEHHLPKIRAQVPPDVWASAWGKGRQMTLEQAIAYEANASLNEGTA